MNNETTQTPNPGTLALLSNICLSMTVRQVLFSFKGRIPRRTFWAVFGFLIALCLIVAIVLNFAIFPVMDKIDFDRLPLLVQIPIGIIDWLVVISAYGLFIWVVLANNVKRWHDLGYSGWMVLLGLIPFVGIIVIIFTGFFLGQKTPNEYGPDPLAMLPNTALEPTAAAPSVLDVPSGPQASDSSTSPSSGGGSALDR